MGIWCCTFVIHFIISTVVLACSARRRRCTTSGAPWCSGASCILKAKLETVFSPYYHSPFNWTKGVQPNLGSLAPLRCLLRFAVAALEGDVEFLSTCQFLRDHAFFLRDTRCEQILRRLYEKREIELQDIHDIITARSIVRDTCVGRNTCAFFLLHFAKQKLRGAVCVVL